MPFFYRVLLIVFLSLVSLKVGAQVEDTISQGSPAKVRIYLDCNECDFTFFRRNLNIVDFVRDPKLADLHILVTGQRTAGNGTEFGLNFIGLGPFADLHYKLKTISPESETEVLKWERLLKIVNVGILPYVSSTAEMDRIKIEFDTKDAKDELSPDPWNFWVFRLESGLEFEAEESQKEYALSNSIRADHITEKIKFRSELGYELNREIYKDDEETIENKRQEASFESGFVYSLGPRWSVGMFADVSSSTYMNNKIAIETGPGVEYNIFPWDKSDRKVFTFAYHVRSNYFRYNDLTIFGKTEEWKASQALRLSLFLRQPWGEVENTLEGSHYFSDFKKNRLSLESDVSVKVFKGLSVFLELEAELIHDQLYLSAGEATRDEILLKQRKLATAFEVSGDFGIRFTFGSVYNNVVNQRL